MPAVRSTELTLLLLTSTLEVTEETSAKLTEFIARHPPDWERLYALAERHRVTPFLYRGLRDQPAVPAGLLKRLRHDCQRSATDNLLKLHHYREVAELFLTNGIGHLALKGIYLAEHGYPSSSLRIIGDLDLLVAREHVFNAVALLESLGYRPSRHQTHYREAGQERMLADLYEITLGKSVDGGHFVIDLHWEVICLKKEFNAFRLEDVTGNPALTTEWLVMLLVAHHGVNETWRQLFFVNDLYVLLKNKPLNWPWLLAKTRSLGIDAIFLAGLHWCRELDGLPLPPEVERAVSAPRVRALAAAYERGWEAEQSVPMTKMAFRQIHFFAKAQPRLDQKVASYVRFFGQRIFYYSFVRLGGRRFYLPKAFGFITLAGRAIRYVRRYLMLPR